MLTVYVISGGTGETAERVARSALAQFEDAPIKLVRRGEIRTAEQVRDIVQQAAQSESIILHTFVSDELRHVMLTEARLHDVDALDVLGSVLDRFSLRLNLAPLERPGRSSQLADARSREIEAVDFAFRHDDGQRVKELDKAEVVLVGVSRAMKTPTTLYLAYRGWFAANVPLIPQVSPPSALLACPSERVFCLVMNPGRLRELRQTRATQTAIPMEPYASPKHISQELQYCERLCLENSWRTIDVTGKSVEEVAREIIALLPKHRKTQ
ncbi:MAG: kinase/pyrophosphorylase [Pirellulales bacterium]|nr:kinase/pyrophosphorylase [Pirellulales bacterium]